MQGRFITFEGVEGSGKSTQAALLAAALRGRGVEVVATREPGGTPLGERVRDLLLDPAGEPCPLAELLLLEAARAQLVAQVIRPALGRGAWVIADRFSDSSLAYQSGARGLAEETVRVLNALACAGLVPDRTIVLDLSLETALPRARGRASTTASNRRFEDYDDSFHRKVAASYLALAAREAHRVALVDGGGASAEVHARVLAALGDLLP